VLLVHSILHIVDDLVVIGEVLVLVAAFLNAHVPDETQPNGVLVSSDLTREVFKLKLDVRLWVVRRINCQEGIVVQVFTIDPLRDVFSVAVDFSLLRDWVLAPFFLQLV
jgi:hypothetical protein